MNPATPSPTELAARVAHLEAENARLRLEASSVADANVRAALELVGLSESRQRDLEAKNHEIAAALQRAEEASRQKTRFLANMSHELRTPLNGILGMAELLLHSDLDLRQREFVQTIATTADSFLEMVNELLDFSKIEAGKVELESLVFDLWEAIEAVAQDLHLRCSAKGLACDFYLAPDLPRMVTGDPLRLRQILLNLAANAAKFTDSGSVGLTATLDPVTGHLRAAVRDTGCGIPATTAARLFEPFVQADASTTRTYGGTGLGLAISRQFARRMGGEITFTSEPGAGSEFTLSLALTPVSCAMPPSTPQRRALVVAHNATTQRMLADHLPRLGYQVFADGAAASTFDLVIVECPNGASDARALPSTHPGSRETLTLLLVPPGDTTASPGSAEYRNERTLLLPLRPSQLSEVLPSTRRRVVPAPASGTTSASVLVAEDIAVNRKVVEAQLARLGCRVTSVENGEDAVRAAMDKSFDLILMDCQMPRMDGLQATSAIRTFERSRAQHTPIVALTANALPGDRDACLAAGMDGYLTKPLRQAELVSVLRRWQLLRS